MRKIKEYFLCFGISKIIQTDNGLEFCSIVSELYYENLGIKHIRSSPSYPQSNGKVESQNKTLKRAINIALQTDDNIDLFDCIYDIYTIIIVNILQLGINQLNLKILIILI